MALAKEWRAERAAIVFARRLEAANLALRFEAFNLDRLGKLIDGDVARVIANFQPQVNLPRAARIILPVILASVRQARCNRCEAAIRPVATAAKISAAGSCNAL